MTNMDDIRQEKHVNDLTLPELDYLVFREVDYMAHGKQMFKKDMVEMGRADYSPSTRWDQCGPLIQSFGIWLSSDGAPEDGGEWIASHEGCDIAQGPTPLIAVCRCILISIVSHYMEIDEEYCWEPRILAARSLMR